MTAACLVRSFDHLATAQQRLGRNREALATLAAALDIFESDLLDPALEHARKTENPRCRVPQPLSFHAWDAQQAVHQHVGASVLNCTCMLLCQAQ